MERKYELTDETTIHNGVTLHRIKALRDFGSVKAGDLGGFIEKEDNLSHNGNCWVYDNAMVYGKAFIYDNARVCAHAKVYDNARVDNNSIIDDYALVYGEAKVSNSYVFSNAKVFDYAVVRNYSAIAGHAKIFGYAVIRNGAHIRHDAEISSLNQYIHIGPIGSRDDFTTFYKGKNGIIYVSCGCFHDTLDKFIEAVNETHGDNKFGKQYLCAIDFIKNIL